MYEYDLFAVINHEGQMDNGHYTNFARFQDEVSGYGVVLLYRY
jgi:ubiquitin carboxyl-terminal hydrolase 22/27/51